MEYEFLTFSTLIFGILIISCFKTLRGSYLAKELAEQKVVQQQRSAQMQSLSIEMERIHEDFNMKMAQAIKGELRK